MTAPFSHLLLTVCFLLLPSCCQAKQQACPSRTAGWASGENGAAATLSIQNGSPLMQLAVVWVDFKGQDAAEHETIVNAKLHTMETFVNHHFRIYGIVAGGERVLLKEHRVWTAKDKVVILGDCDDVVEAMKEIRRETDLEMKALAHDQKAPCIPENDSTKWSCNKHISKDEYEERLAKYAGISYGFNSTLESQDRAVGDTIDRYWLRNIKLIPRVTSADSPGYLKMNFTSRLREIIMPWYQDRKKGARNDRVQPHRVIPGGFTNSHTVGLSLLNMDEDPPTKQQLVTEMQRILEWWTGQSLVPTATFGIRIYHQDSMLINHVDRADTHIASAVIQVDQSGLNKGWPLEILHPTDGSCSEVYLQPGELVLYEGARFRHGRPMRLQGSDFANIFSHFRPADWNGPNSSPKYDGKLDEHGYLWEIDGEDDREEL